MLVFTRDSNWRTSHAKKETVLDILSLKHNGLSRRAIARKLGISRTTVNRYLENPDLAFAPVATRERKSKLDTFADNIEAWLNEDSGYSATWIYDRLRCMGFYGSYEIVKRRVSRIKNQRQAVAYMRFETEPGYQAQVDFGEFQIEHADGCTEKLYLFAMILGYSRRIYGQFIKRCDLSTFLDCHINAFAHFGGVPVQILYDRMKNVYIGKLAGKTKFNDSLVGFALHYGFEPRVAPAYAAWVKGKVERPFSFIREGFWRGYSYLCLDTANRDLEAWLAQKEQRVHGTTHEVVAKRFEREQPHLKPLPQLPFDTSYRLYRKVAKDCTVRFEANSFVVPHTLVGKQIVLRVKEHSMRIFDDDRLVVTYTIPADKGNLVQDKRFYQALRDDKEMNKRKYQHGGRGKGRAKRTISPSKPLYDMDVSIRPLYEYDRLTGEVHP
jgi:transposase